MNYLLLEAMDLTTLLWQVVPFALVIVVMYFMLIGPQKRQEKKLNEMRRELQVGDSVTTVGGIVGRIVSMKEDTVVVETGSERNKIRFLRAAINTVEKLEME